MNIQEHAYQLTAYEKGGLIDIKDYIKDLIKEEFNYLNLSTLLEAYNEYCSQNSYEEFFINEEETFEIFFKSMTDVIRATQYGDYNLYDEYIKFNGYGNLDSYTDEEVKTEIMNDTSFIEYTLEWIESCDFINLDEITDNEEEILKEAYKLVKLGY